MVSINKKHPSTPFKKMRSKNLVKQLPEIELSYTASISSQVIVSRSRIWRSFKRVLFASCPPKNTKLVPKRVTD
jgi:hypothetical protein